MGKYYSWLELIRKVEGAEARAYGLTIPLMLKSDGTKFGKSAVIFPHWSAPPICT